MKSQPPNARDWVYVVLVAIALLYAFFAGLRTVSDFDLGWQLATGRYILQHHSIPSTEVFSYTAQGAPWLYPPFSGVIFYLLYLFKGYAALSWLGALACVATVALIAGQGIRVSAALAIIAVPAIAFRTTPRAELFSTVIFAAFLIVLWRHYDVRKTHLWLLPLLMIAWVNLHTGFVAGLALIAASVLAEAWRLLFSAQREGALHRLRQAAPWIAAPVAATLINPWGWRIFQAIARQNAVSQLHTEFISEWSGVHFSSAIWQQLLSLRDPAGADWWLLIVAALAIIFAARRWELGPALILALGAYEALAHIRFQALFAILTCVVGGSILSKEFGSFRPAVPSEEGPSSRAKRFSQPALSRDRAWVAIAAVLVLMAGIRIRDLVTNRYYLWSDQITLFGAGPSWWFPERAASFIRNQRLPGNVFGDYNLGGYLSWKLGPEYPDYFDGRFIPFGSDLFARQRSLVALPLDSPEWQREADARNIQTVIFSAARFAGLGNFPLQPDCESHEWAPVYLDDVSIVFVRNSRQNSELVKRLAIQCKSVAIAPPALASNGSSRRASAEEFQFLANSASIDYLLSRDSEATGALASAEAIFSDDPDLHMLQAQMAMAHNQPADAEREYLAATRLRPTDSSWFALANLYAAERRYPEAEHCLLESVSLSQVPWDRYRALGKLYLLMNQPEDALGAFDKAARTSPYKGAEKGLDPEFSARLAESTAAAYQKLGKIDQAISSQQAAVQLTPEAAGRWKTLADLYQSAGRSDQAAEASQRAENLEGTQPRPAR